MSDLVLGIDGGGTKTLMVLADAQGRIHDRLAGAGSNPMDNPDWLAPFATFARALEGRQDRIRAGVIGMGGYAEDPALDAMMQGRLAGLFTFPFELDNDVVLARDAAFPDAPGILLIAGTGSMAVCRAEEGGLRVGGWGHVFGDEGSAHWVGCEALRRAACMVDGRLPASAGYLDAILGRLGDGPALERIFGWLNREPHLRSAIAGLAVEVNALAEAGDPVATAILDQAVADLARHVQALWQRSGHADQPWSILGGMSRSAPVIAGLEARLGPRASPVLPPEGGALWRAATRAGWQPDAAWVAAVRTGLAAG